MSTAATPAPVQAPAYSASSSLLDKVQALEEKSVKSPTGPKAVLEVQDDQDEICFVISKQKFLEAVRPSKSGDTDGVTLAIEGSFPYTLANGQVVKFNLSMKGGWAGVKVAR